MFKIENQRKLEISKYENIYDNKQPYVVSSYRMTSITKALSGVSPKHSLLDVGCGIGKIIEYAESIGYCEVYGIEPVESICGGKIIQGTANRLPFGDKIFQVVTLFDVIEHLIEDDIIPTLQELKRVCYGTIFISPSNVSDIRNGVQLHISRKPYTEWDTIFKTIFFKEEVIWRKDLTNSVSQMWQINFKEI